MKTLKTPHACVLRVFAICLLLTTNNNATADDKNSNKQSEGKSFHSQKAKERMETIRKLKLLNALELDEAKSDKFLSKLTANDKKIDENRKAHKKAIDELENAINAGSKDIAEKTNSIVQLQDEFNRLVSDKTKEMKGILNETEFAKYVIFENKFLHNFFDSFMNGNYKHHKKNSIRQEEK